MYGPNWNPAGELAMPIAVMIRSRMTQNTAATTMFRMSPNLNVPGFAYFEATANPHLSAWRKFTKNVTT